ncbi:VWA domain-containing protein [candidate division WOR-3 bacterium]|nr:VWA domain-containing protein [candidate division WOR-3 bacterium]
MIVVGIQKPTLKKKILHLFKKYLRLNKNAGLTLYPGNFHFKKKGNFKKKPEYRQQTPLFESEKGIFKSARFEFRKILKRFRRTQSFRTRKFSRRALVKNTVTGRNYRLTLYKSGENSLAFYYSLLKIFSEKQSSKKPVELRQKDLLGWDRAAHQSLNMILVVDVSTSVINFARAFSKIINSLTFYFNKNKDRIGVISLQGQQAKTLNHPTHNYKVVTKSLLSLKVHGKTPLADGLLKSLDMARLEKFRNRGSKSLVVLLSDCYPEPLTGKFKNIFEDPAYINSLSAAKLFKKSKIFLLLINPNFKNRNGDKSLPPGEKDSKLLPGEKLSEMITENAGGKLIRLYPRVKSSKTIYSDQERYDVSPKDIEKIINGVSSALNASKNCL